MNVRDLEENPLSGVIFSGSPLSEKKLLPLTAAVALKPWFDRDALQQGFDLIESGQVIFFFYYRTGIGAVFADQAAVSLLVPASDTLSQGFLCRDGSCSSCAGNWSTGIRCRHQAAAALLALRQDEGGNDLLPVWRFFKQSPWSAVGAYLVEEMESGGFTLKGRLLDNELLLEGQKENGFSLTVRLPERLAEMAACFHKVPLHGKDVLPEGIGCLDAKTVMDNLVRLTATETEQKLAVAGSRSKGEQRDTSLLITLVRNLTLLIPASHLHVSRDSDSRLFIVSAAVDGVDVFRLTLPRSRTMDLLGRIDLPGLETARLSPAQPFSRVEFTGSGDAVRVEHCLRLDDGREFARADLKEQRYGVYYYLKGDGFLSTAAMPADERIEEKARQAPSLFDCLKKVNQPDSGFTVVRDELPDFLKRNGKAIASSRHRVESALLDLQITTMPERLELTDFEEIDDWCYIAGYYDLGNQQIDLAELILKSASGQEYIPGRRWLRLAQTPLDWLYGLGEDRITAGEDGARTMIRLRRHELLALSCQIGDVGIQVRQQRMAEEVERLVHCDDWLVADDLPPMPGHLRDYQLGGVAWLFRLQQNRLGGILADDMGLGKTHQSLALIQLLAAGAKEKIRCLVVCPTTVLYHWLDKGEMFFSDLAMFLYYGPDRDLEQALESDVVLTSYGVLRQDSELLRTVKFDLVLFDEMQSLKNVKTGVHQAALELDSRSIIGLTGTPIENSLQELKALFDICLPGLFSNRSFRRQFIDHDSAESRRQLAGLIKPFVLRRTRGQVLEELPEVIEDIRGCRLSDDQVSLYRQLAESAKPLVDDLLDDFEPNKEYANILGVISRLKQVCDHPCILEGCVEWDRYESGKWKLLLGLLDECMAGGSKMVIFSQFTKMLDILNSYLDHAGIGYVSLRGGMTPGARKKAIDVFNKDEVCMVCSASLLAGGLGIDLTAAQVVIHYDRWWNPAREEQATARVHRMGQKHVVQVIKLVTMGTLEEKIHGLIEKKRTLAEDVITEDDASILKQLSREDLAALMSWQE
ncbi:MAG: hypothetical protein GQ559_11480 [Desulfobulbaceae bacterium]|nr:hypothetical protein [Desulfobulbaceae bacterium]